MRRNSLVLLVLLGAALTLVALPILPVLAAPPTQAGGSGPIIVSTPHGPLYYRLKTADENVTAQVIVDLNAAYQAAYANPTGQQNGYGPQDYWQALTTALTEAIARYPQSQHAAEWRKQLAILQADRWPSTGSVKSFQQLLQTALAAGEANPADLAPWLAGLGQGFKVTAFPVTNLFGDKAENQVVVISNQEYSHSLWALRLGRGGVYQAYPLYENWFYGAFDPSQIQFQDLNANRFTEVLVPFIRRAGSGAQAACTQALDVIEWDRKQFVNLAAAVDERGVDDTANGDCLGFRFEPGPRSTQWIVSVLQVGKAQRRVIYEWTGKVFRWARAETVLDPPEETLDWVLSAGPYNDQAVQMLAGWVQAWPAGLGESWGPAAQDFFRFKLGTWYALRGEKDQAITALEQLRDQPARPEFRTAARWADLFLRGYRSRARIYQACALVMEQFLKERETFRQPEGTYAGLKEAWGVSAPAWEAPQTINDPRTSGREDPLDVCSLQEALRVSLNASGVRTRGELESWLRLQHIQWTGLKEGDADGDGQDDWVMLVNSGPVGNLQLWAIFRQPEGILAEVVTNFDSTEKDPRTTWFHILPEYNTPVHNLYQAAEEIIIFRAVQNDGQVGFEYPVAGTTAQRYNWDRVQTVVLVEKTLYEVLTVHEMNGDRQTFLWDPKTFQIRLTGPSMNTRIDQIEALLFDPTAPDYESAADHAAHLLARGIHEDEEYRLGYGPAHVRPRVLYLLALAYDLDGRTDKALLAYWKLWNDFPANPFAYLAQARLEPARP